MRHSRDSLQNRERVLKIIEMKKQGHILSDISIETDSSMPYVRRILEQYGLLDMQQRGNKYNKIVQLFRDGHTIQEIMDETGMSQSRVYAIIQEHGGRDDGR